MRLVCLISGSGTTLQNLIDRRVGDVVGVIASRPDCFGIVRAERAGIPCTVVAPPKSPKEQDYSKRVFDTVRTWTPELVLLCGWLKLLTIPTDFEGRVLNIHPSLLPAFGGQGMYGMRVHDAVIASGAIESGCTVHIADNTYDTGPILVQKRVPVLPGDTAKALSKRVHEAECDAYPEAIAMMARRLDLH